MRAWSRAGTTATALFVVALQTAGPLRAYSVLTHEAVIDSVWESDLEGMLRARFPMATEVELREAHAYVYGGSLAADMGYAPMSSQFFSDLMHYVRSGDVVETLIHQSQTLNEYAFALGALAHYVGDRTGHPLINRITPLTYPKLAAEFGPVVTYEQAHAAHLRTEFGLDVLQLARGKYAPNSYRDFIGFEIDEDGLKRAFESTYGLKLSDVMMPDIAIGVYRLSVGTVVPEMTKVAWESKHDDIVRLAPETDSDSFRYTLTKQEYEIQWGHKYKRPGWRQRLFAVLFKIIPPVGPFAPLKYRVVPESGEALFLQAFDATVVEYRRQLENVRADRLQLENYNLDTGEPVRRGEYELADESYKRLLKKLESNTWRDVSGALRSDIQSFYGTGAAAVDNKTARRLRELR